MPEPTRNYYYYRFRFLPPTVKPNIALANSHNEVGSGTTVPANCGAEFTTSNGIAVKLIGDGELAPGWPHQQLLS